MRGWSPVPRLDRLPQLNRNNLLMLPVQVNDTTPFTVPAKPLTACRIAIVTTAGLHRRDDRPFGPGEQTYRVIPSDTPLAEILLDLEGTLHIAADLDVTLLHGRNHGRGRGWVAPISRSIVCISEKVPGAAADRVGSGGRRSIGHQCPNPSESTANSAYFGRWGRKPQRPLIPLQIAESAHFCRSPGRSCHAGGRGFESRRSRSPSCPRRPRFGRGKCRTCPRGERSSHSP